MSAGGLSYSGLTNYGKTTLPSVDSWGTNMNILRDPPKSITTRRIDKVGETSSITTMIDESGNRACEAIQVYARGVNPFVSVSYSNEGNNGGQRSGGLVSGGQRAAKLPYTIMRDGAFRPPVLLQEDLLPLSRMPRVWTTAFTQPGFTDFSKKMRTCGTAKNTREVKTLSLQGCVRPTATYKIEKPLSEPFEVKYVIQPSIKVKATSGMRTMDLTQQHVSKPTKEIDDTPLHARAHANYTDTRIHKNNNSVDTTRYVQDTNAHSVVSNISTNQNNKNDLTNMDTTRYVQDTNVHSVASNISSNKHNTPIDSILDLSDLPVKDRILNSSVSSSVSGPEQTKYFHNDIELKRRLPEYNMTTNVADQTKYKRQEPTKNIELDRNIPTGSFQTNIVSRGQGHTDPNSRQVRLLPKINPGGYSVPGQIPTYAGSQHSSEPRESEKARMNRIVTNAMQSRFTS